MAKSKRQKIVHLTKVAKKTKESKNVLIEQVWGANSKIREALGKYEYVYLFQVENMRNVFLKQIRGEWKESRFFMGKTTVMAKAMGTTVETEVKENLHLLAERVKGHVGLLLTNEAPEKVLVYFEQFMQIDYARTGAVAIDTVVVPAGPVMKGEAPFPHTLEGQARALGMPTILKSGVVMLNGDYTICEEGQQLTSEQSRLLKLFDVKMAAFKIVVTSYFHDGQLFAIDRDDDNDDALEPEDADDE